MRYNVVKKNCTIFSRFGMHSRGSVCISAAGSTVDRSIWLVCTQCFYATNFCLLWRLAYWGG